MASASIVLLGDSIFDNAAYTGDEPDVAAHLRSLVDDDAQVTLVAKDGTTTLDFTRQLDDVPKHATHLVLSLGGNDALLNADLLGMPADSVAESLDLFADRREDFERNYNRCLDALLDWDLPTTVCTIYGGDLDDDDARRADTALMIYNDVILRGAFRRGFDVVDLRFVCTHHADYANPVEPSGAGGLKIARAIGESLAMLAAKRTRVTTGRPIPKPA